MSLMQAPPIERSEPVEPTLTHGPEAVKTFRQKARRFFVLGPFLPVALQPVAG
jgi:hypothetical protein